MGKKLKDLKWESVALEGFPVSAMKENFQGFVGLEECTNYGLDKESKKPRMKNEKKRKRKVIESATVTSKKAKRSSSAAAEITIEAPSKNIKLSNGFTVETCQKLKPSRTNDIPSSSDQIRTSNDPKYSKKQKEDLKTNKKTKLKLGESALNKDTSIPLQDMEAWSSLQIPEEILKALAEQGFKKPTKIQELTLPTAMLGRRDILGAAETGSGKTLAFGIPILAGIMKLKAQLESGVDVYDLPYKKTSAKKAKDVEEKIPKTAAGNKKTAEKKNTESSEEGYSSDDGNNVDDEQSDNSDNDSDESGDEHTASDEDTKKSDEEFLEEYDVPLRKKESSTDEGNDSDGSDENYVHLSDMLDSDDVADSSNDEDDFIDNPDDDGSGEETDSQDEYQDEEQEKMEEAEGLNKDGIGCVKVIDNIEIPGHTVTKTGKPLYALILTPTRELAMQINQHLISAAKYTGIRIATIVGGMAAVKQERVLAKSPEVVVATPGRLWELLRQGQSHLGQLDSIKFLAIDETDRMVERNHFDELTPLLERLNADDRRRGARQNFVFSATLTMVHDLPQHMKGKKVTKRGKIINRKIQKMTPQQKVKKLVAMIGMTDPKVVDITTQNLGTAETLTECRITCTLEQKDYYLFYLLKRHPGRTIVFCNSIGSVKRLAQLFGLLQCSPLPLHASMPQRQRLKNLERFRDDPRGVLVATDVAARGLDIPNVDHVVHYQVPRTAENYVHRSGRTARANKEGLTILMIEPGEALNYAKLCRTLNKTTEVPTFPVPQHILNSMKDIVTLAREVDRLSLASRRAAQESGWLDRAARDMDMLLDEDFVPIKHKEVTSTKALQAKKKQLESLLSKPVFPKGFSYKYPTLNDPDVLGVRSEDNALQVMKNAMASGELKREKRKGKNSQLLKLAKRLKAK